MFVCKCLENFKLSKVIKIMKRNLWKWLDLKSQSTTEPDIEDFENEILSKIDTFTRETIQNSSDATIKGSTTEIIFKTGKAKITDSRILNQLNELRATSSELKPIGNGDKEIKWLLASDQNTTGILGNVEERTDDYWNFFLNWGKSNKKEQNTKGLNGRGRITILEASLCKTIIVITFRDGDKEPLVNALSLFGQHKDIYGKLKDYWAYLVKDEKDNVFQLHQGDDLLSDIVLITGEIEGITKNPKPGTHILILEPHEQITKEHIIASSIEHFLPSFLQEKMNMKYNESTLDSGNVIEEAKKLINEDLFKSRDLSPKNADFYLDFINEALSGPTELIKLNTARRIKPNDLDSDKIKELKTKFNNDELIKFEIIFPLVKKNTENEVSFRVGIKKSTGFSVENYFRDGMAIPSNQKRLRSSGKSGIVFIPEGALSTYLNICEGKAHLAWRQTEDVKDKLIKNGYNDSLHPRNLCTLILQDLDKHYFEEDKDHPDYLTLAEFFPMNDNNSNIQETYDNLDNHLDEDEDEDENDNDEIDNANEDEDDSLEELETLDEDEFVDPLSQSINYKISKIKDGFKIKGNHKPGQTKVKAFDLSIAFSIASGKDPFSKFNPLDFDFVKHISVAKNLTLLSSDKATHTFNINDQKKPFLLTINGFDKKRDLETLFKVL